MCQFSIGIWLVGLGFLVMAAWTLRPDRDEQETAPSVANRGAFFTTFLLFFLMAMGDKTQIATAGLAAHHGSVVRVVAGSTLVLPLSGITLSLRILLVGLVRHPVVRQPSGAGIWWSTLIPAMD